MNISLLPHKELITYLDQSLTFPTPKPNDSLEKIMYDAGRRSLIDLLLFKLKEQEEESF